MHLPLHPFFWLVPSMLIITILDHENSFSPLIVFIFKNCFLKYLRIEKTTYKPSTVSLLTTSYELIFAKLREIGTV